MEKFIQAIVRDAGAAVMKKFGKIGVKYAKSDRVWDVVTKADLLSESIIITAIKKRYPDHGIISEESGSHQIGSEYLWIIDPIDGTFNYSRGVPMFGVMIALVRSGRVVFSAVHLPAVGELFFAKAGGGAYVNGKQIHTSKARELLKTAGVGSSSMHKRNQRFLNNLFAEASSGHGMLGSFLSIAVNGAYVASGRRDWMVSLSGSIWDFAPVYLLLKESGCKVTDTKGKPWKLDTLEIVAANPTLHKQLLKLTKGV